MISEVRSEKALQLLPCSLLDHHLGEASTRPRGQYTALSRGPCGRELRPPVITQDHLASYVSQPEVGG